MIDKLERAGLPRNEAIIYHNLLAHGSQRATQLARISEMDRTLVYQVLARLEQRGLVGSVKKGLGKVFSAADPSHLLDPIEKQRAVVEDVVTELEAIRPEPVPETTVQTYEGKRALRSVLRDALKSDSFLSFGATGRAGEQLYETERLARSALTQGIDLRVIFSARTAVKGVPGLPHDRIRIMDAPMQATTSIFDDTVLIHVADEVPRVMAITDRTVAESYRQLFEQLWEQADTMEKQKK